MRMKPRLFYSFIFFAFLFNTAQSLAASFPPPDSAIQPRKPHKLTRQQFLDRYGTDDSSRALIQYYFPKRKAAVRNILQSSGLLVLAGLLSIVVFSKGNGIENGLGDFFILLILLSSAYVAVGFLVVNATLLLLQSRRRLYNMLQAYRNGKGLPRRISRKKSFLRLLKKEQL